MRNLIIASILSISAFAHAHPRYSPTNKFELGEEVAVDRAAFYSPDEIDLDDFITCAFRGNVPKNLHVLARVIEKVPEGPESFRYTLSANIMLPAQLSYDEIRALALGNNPFPRGPTLRRVVTLWPEFIGKIHSRPLHASS